MTLNDITVKQLIAIQSVKPDTMKGQKEAVEIIFGVNADDMDIEEFFDKATQMSDLFTKGDKSFKRDIVIDGVSLKAKDIKDFSTREFIDFDTLAQDDSKTNMTTLLALIYTNEDFDNMDYIESIGRKRELVEKMDAGTALGAIDFFSKALLRYIKNIAVSSPAAREMMETNPKMKKQMEMINNYLDGAGN